MDDGLDDEFQRAGHAPAPADRAEGWVLLVYRLPSKSSRGRVAVWRDLKRLGAYYPQQAVCVLPDRPVVREALDETRRRIQGLGGSSFFVAIEHLDQAEEAEVRAGLLEASQRDYDEIVEECDTKFVKEIQFERFRENYTFEEAEEIRADLDKLKRWFLRVAERDWLGAPGRAHASERIERCEALLEEFEAEVYERVQQEKD